MPSQTPDTPPVEIKTGAEPDASIIWLHGLGADGHDFEPIVPELRLAAGLGVRFVFPHAPMRPVTLNGGYVMRAWYDMAVTDSGLLHNSEHIEESVEIVRGLIERERARGVASRRIVLAGFSQGGAIALHAGLRHPDRLGGLVSLSAPVPFLEKLVAEVDPANADIPVFMAHGTYDPVVPFDHGDAAHLAMLEYGLKIKWHEFRMEHTVIPEEISALTRWFQGVLNGS